jgi:hypothetical protein
METSRRARGSERVRPCNRTSGTPCRVVVVAVAVAAEWARPVLRAKDLSPLRSVSWPIARVELKIWSNDEMTSAFADHVLVPADVRAGRGSSTDRKTLTVH